MDGRWPAAVAVYLLLLLSTATGAEMVGSGTVQASEVHTNGGHQVGELLVLKQQLLGDGSMVSLVAAHIEMEIRQESYMFSSDYMAVQGEPSNETHEAFSLEGASLSTGRLFVAPDNAVHITTGSVQLSAQQPQEVVENQYLFFFEAHRVEVLQSVQLTTKESYMVVGDFYLSIHDVPFTAQLTNGASYTYIPREHGSEVGGEVRTNEIQRSAHLRVTDGQLVVQTVKESQPPLVLQKSVTSEATTDTVLLGSSGQLQGPDRELRGNEVLRGSTRLDVIPKNNGDRLEVIVQGLAGGGSADSAPPTPAPGSGGIVEPPASDPSTGVPPLGIMVGPPMLGLGLGLLLIAVVLIVAARTYHLQRLAFRRGRYSIVASRAPSFFASRRNGREAFMHYVTALIAQDRLQEAHGALDENPLGLTLDPGLREYLLAVVLARQGCPHEASRYLSLSVRKDPSLAAEAKAHHDLSGLPRPRGESV